MPPVSKAQALAMRLAYQAKLGVVDPYTLTGSAQQMYESMNSAQLAEFAKVDETGLPEKVKQSKK